MPPEYALSPVEGFRMSVPPEAASISEYAATPPLHIGFTGKTAEDSHLLSGAGVRQVIDVRQNRSGQLSGFSKYPDLSFLLRKTPEWNTCMSRCSPLPETSQDVSRTKFGPAYEADFLAVNERAPCPRKSRHDFVVSPGLSPAPNPARRNCIAASSPIFSPATGESKVTAVRNSPSRLVAPKACDSPGTINGPAS